VNIRQGDSMYIIQRKSDAEFFVSQNNWSSEYPDARLFQTEKDAIQVAKRIAQYHDIVVIADFGMADQREVWEG